MRLQSIRRLKLIFIIIFFNINSSCADSIVEIRGLHKELSCLSTVDQSVFRLIILDLNNCQTCNIWFPKLIKNGDTGIFIYFRGARIKDKEKLAKRFKISTSRVLVGSFSEDVSEQLFKYVYVEVYGNDDWVSAYTVNDLTKVSELCNNEDQKDVIIESEDVFSRFDKIATSGNYIYGLANPLMQLTRTHKDSSNIEIYPSSRYDSFFWSSVYPEMCEKDSTLLTMTESITEMSNSNEIFKLFYPVNFCTVNDRLFIATQPYMVRKINNKLQSRGFNLIVEIDQNWNIINHWQAESDDNCSPLIGFVVQDSNFYFANIELDGQYLRLVGSTSTTSKSLNKNEIKYDTNFIKKFEFMKYSTSAVETGLNTMFFGSLPFVTIINQNKTSSIDISKFLGIQLRPTSIYNNLSITYKNDTLSALCAIDRNMVSIKIVSDQLVSRRYYSLQKKYNPLFSGTNKSGFLYYQTKEDYFKSKITIE